MAKDFVEQFEIEFPVYTDPDKLTYRFMGFKRSFGLGMSSFGHARRAMKKGFAQGMILGDAWQQGGEALFSAKGEVLWSHSASQAGTHSTRKQLLAALEASL